MEKDQNINIEDQNKEVTKTGSEEQNEEVEKNYARFSKQSNFDWKSWY